MDIYESNDRENSYNDRKNNYKEARYILEKMDEVRADNQHILTALENLAKIEVQPPSHNAGDVASAAKANAMCEVVKARETTNQKILSMLERVYDDFIIK